MALALLSTVNAMTIIGPRVYYAMAENGAFFQAAKRVHPRWNTPWIAIAAQAVCCCVLILSGTFESLVQYVGFSLWLFTMLAVAGLLQLRRRPGWKSIPATNIAFPLIPGIYILTSAWVLVYMVILRPRESGLGLLTIAAGAIFYRLVIRDREAVRARRPGAEVL
jgi:APA family basic amino acid/polyamine antiporter